MTVSQDLAAHMQATQMWIDDLVQRLGWHDHERGYLALLATLHALRDCLARDETIFLAAQLPVLLRGLYYEGWHPGRSDTTMTRSAFLDRIHTGMHRDPAVDPEQVARAVLALLVARLPAAEIEDAKAATPSELRGLWPS
jgi:uncharacterized protein (DUF2267 family)